MDDSNSNPSPPAPPQNFTRAGVIGKVPEMRNYRGGKRVKIAGSRKRHVGQLKQHGQISQAVASRHGL